MLGGPLVHCSSRKVGLPGKEDRAGVDTVLCGWLAAKHYVKVWSVFSNKSGFINDITSE